MNAHFEFNSYNVCRIAHLPLTQKYPYINEQKGTFCSNSNWLAAYHHSFPFEIRSDRHTPNTDGTYIASLCVIRLVYVYENNSPTHNSTIYLWIFSRLIKSHFFSANTLRSVCMYLEHIAAHTVHWNVFANLPNGILLPHTKTHRIRLNAPFCARLASHTTNTPIHPPPHFSIVYSQILFTR